jgi:hypothetical protein
MPGNATVRFKGVGGEPEGDRYRACRATLVGPGVNQPEPYEGYGGFVGWSGVTRLKSGRWMVTFTSGLWHATLPWTEEIAQDPACRRQFEEWEALGLPDRPAPRGGRAHVMHSDDEGLTWSLPRTLVDTERDDRHPTILELADGTLFCSWFGSRYPRVTHAFYMLARPGDAMWSQPMHPGGEPQEGSFGNGSAIRLRDDSVVWAISGGFGEEGPARVRIFRSRDSGTSFEPIATVASDHDLHEPTLAELPDGRLIMVSRREGDMCWSEDGGESWSPPEGTGWGLFDPHLLQLPNGVLALFAGSYHGGGIRVLLSPDGGLTWHGPDSGAEEPYGYSVDRSVYGYCHPMLLEDGTVYLVYLHTGGHRTDDARTESLFGLRLRVHDDAGGIDILPAPGSPAAMGLDGADAEAGDGGDPELGDRM